MQVLPQLYVGSLSNSQDSNLLKKFKITHIVSILENPYRFETFKVLKLNLIKQTLYQNIDCDFLKKFKDRKYFHIKASESAKQNLEKIFPLAIDFIHRARLENGRVLIHW